MDEAETQMWLGLRGRGSASNKHVTLWFTCTHYPHCSWEIYIMVSISNVHRFLSTIINTTRAVNKQDQFKDMGNMCWSVTDWSKIGWGTNLSIKDADPPKHCILPLVISCTESQHEKWWKLSLSLFFSNHNLVTWSALWSVHVHMRHMRHITRHIWDDYIHYQ